MSRDVLIRSVEGDVLTATLNRPAKANALSLELLEALDELARDIEYSLNGHSGPRALVLTGAGDKTFSAGADVTQLIGLDYDTALQRMRNGQRIFGRIESLPLIVIAAINGVALGGGLELAMATDIRFAAPSARLGQPEITLANLPGWGGTQRLPRLIGPSRAMELITTGDTLTATQAKDFGLIDHIEADCLAAAQALADRIARNSRHAVAGAKRAMQIGLRDGFGVGLRAEAAAVAICCQTPEQHRAVNAFLDRRAARP